MPYIKQKERYKFDIDITSLSTNIKHEGDLNYIITSLCNIFLKRGNEPARYKDYNTIIGVLECAKLEMYRRKVSKYEDEKKEKNGDVI